MRFMARRRNIVVWRTSISPAGRHGGLGLERAAPAKPIRRRVRIGAMLALIGLLRLTRILRARWYMSAGIVLTVAGVIMRGSGWNFVLLPGLLLLLSTPLIPASPDGDRKSRVREYQASVAALSAVHRYAPRCNRKPKFRDSFYSTSRQRELSCFGSVP